MTFFALFLTRRRKRCKKTEKCEKSGNALFLSECDRYRKKFALLELLGPFLWRPSPGRETLRTRFEGVSKVHLASTKYIRRLRKKKVAKAIGAPRCSATLTIRAERAFV